MADFGPPEFGKSTMGGESIIYRSRVVPDRVFRFQKRVINSNGVQYWVCSHCRRVKKKENRGNVLPSIRVKDGLIMTDPNQPNNAHFCTGESVSKFEATEVQRAIRTEVKNERKRPLREYQVKNGLLPFLPQLDWISSVQCQWNDQSPFFQTTSSTWKGCRADYWALARGQIKLLQEQLKNLKLIIIDEISMVSNVTLAQIHSRLDEIFGGSDFGQTFGSKNLIVLGDLLQLPPVNTNSQMCFEAVGGKAFGGLSTYALSALG